MARHLSGGISRHLILVLVAICWPGPGRASQQSAPSAAVAAGVVSEDNYPRLRAAFPGGVVGLPDIVYQSPPGFRPLTLDLYLPRRSSGRGAMPLVVYVHGGAWRAGHARAAGAFADFPGVLASLAARGYAVASVNYRLSGEARYPAAVDDLRSALEYLGTNAGRFRIDPDRVILWSSSAGAQIASLAATRCQNAGHGRAGGSCVQGVVSWYGIFDLRTLESPGQSATSPTAAFLGCDPRACGESAGEASPIAHVDASDPPFLILHGLDDRIVPSEQSRAMERRLREAGVPVQAEYFPDVGHSWIGRTPEATRRASLAALARTFAFFDAVFARAR
jgi:acetyl esterase/lipase